MTANRMFVRDLAGVSLAVAIVTVLVMTLARGHRPAADSVTRSPNDRARAATGKPDPVAVGAELYARKGCIACHSNDGAARVGPTFLHDYGSTIALADGTTVAMDDAYIAESIRAPRAKTRRGYPETMPVFDVTLVRPGELAALTAYIRSLR